MIYNQVAEISYDLQSGRGNKTLFSLSDMASSVPYLSVSAQYKLAENCHGAYTYLQSFLFFTKPSFIGLNVYIN